MSAIASPSLKWLMFVHTLSNESAGLNVRATSSNRGMMRAAKMDSWIDHLKTLGTG